MRARRIFISPKECSVFMPPNAKFKYKIGDRVLFKLDGQKYECEVIYIDMDDESRPYLCSFFGDKIDGKAWKLSYDDFDVFDNGRIPNSIIGAHFTEYVNWVREDQLELEVSELEKTKRGDEGFGSTGR